MTPYQFGKYAGINLAGLIKFLRGVTRTADAASNAKPALAAMSSPPSASTTPPRVPDVSQLAVDMKPLRR